MNEVTYPVQERTRFIHGVRGQALPVHEPLRIHGRLVHLNQTWRSRTLLADGRSVRVTLRFDDACKNGHQTFSITGEERRADGSEGSCGCIHELLAEAFPELAHLIKWHGVTTDGPLHYVENAVYHAGDRDHWGKRAGEPRAWQTAVLVGDSPVAHKLPDGFVAWLQSLKPPGLRPWQDVVEVPYNGTYGLGPHYTLRGYPVGAWHEAPFRTRDEAEQWARAINGGLWLRFERVATLYSEGKARDLAAARSAAAWPEATDEELCAEPAVLREALERRLPALLAAFRADVEACGFLWEPGQ
jgi:hypothetical protein